jgi:hypothetical protein
MRYRYIIAILITAIFINVAGKGLYAFNSIHAHAVSKAVACSQKDSKNKDTYKYESASEALIPLMVDMLNTSKYYNLFFTDFHIEILSEPSIKTDFRIQKYFMILFRYIQAANAP